jgi:hypothetical protein
MQTITNYYYDNVISVQWDDDPSIVQRNKIVYSAPIKIYKGVNNLLKIELKNADQKPINLTGYVLTFNIVDDYVYSNAATVLSTNVIVSNATLGYGYAVVSETDLVQLDREQYTYNVLINDTCWGNIATYVDDNYGAAGQLTVSSSAYPVPQPAALDLGLAGDGVDSAIFDFGTI